MSAFMESDAASIQHVQEVINSEKFTCVIVWAKFKRGSDRLVADIKGNVSLMANDQLNFISLCIDDDSTDATDSVEDVILHLNNKYSAQSRDIPSLNIYKCGAWLKSVTNFDLKASNSDFISEQISNIISGGGNSGCCGGGNSGCCGGGAVNSSCCSDGPNDINSAEQLQYVTKSYAGTIGGGSSCCVSVDSGLMGYTANDLIIAGGANLGVGCGNPHLIAKLQKGERVLDLGSGAGIDCFLAGETVGPTGSVIGVDMTPDMIFAARKAAAERKVNHVSFRLGEIEHLPLADSSVDAVLSNCVVNLSPDKGQVMREMFRVLAPNGRVAISDVLLREKESKEQELPEHLRSMESLAC